MHVIFRGTSVLLDAGKIMCIEILISIDKHVALLLCVIFRGLPEGKIYSCRKYTWWQGYITGASRKVVLFTQVHSSEAVMYIVHVVSVSSSKLQWP